MRKKLQSDSIDLGSRLKGMVVAFVAVEPNSEEELGGILHGGGRIAENLEVGSSGILVVRSTCREDGLTNLS